MSKVVVLTNDLQYGLIEAKQERWDCLIEAKEKLADFYNKMRSMNVPIIHLQQINDPDSPALKKLFGDNIPMLKGSPGTRIIEDFCDENDILVEKSKPSGFYNSSLDEVLEKLDVKSLIITGFQTQICVQTTAADAFFRGYKVIVPSDAVISTYEDDTKRALEWLEDYFAVILTTEDIINHLENNDDFENKMNFKNV